MVKVFIVDDHAVFREGLKTVLLRDSEIEIVGEAGDGSEAVSRVPQLQPDVVLMDIHMPYNGLRSTVEILQTVPDAKILMLTVSENEEDLHEAIKAGARGYLLKGMGIDELISAVRSVAAGAAVFTPGMAEKLLADFGSDTKKEADENVSLTDREIEILRMGADGASNKEIAYRLNLSEPTIKNHLRNILGKLHLKNRSQAAVYASRKKWLN